MGSLWVAQGADVTGVTVLTLGWVLKALAVLPLITPFPSHPLPGLQRRPAVPRVGLVGWGQRAAGWQQAEPPPSTALWGHLGVLPRRVRAFGAHCREAAHNSCTQTGTARSTAALVCVHRAAPHACVHTCKSSLTATLRPCAHADTWQRRRAHTGSLQPCCAVHQHLTAAPRL